MKTFKRREKRDTTGYYVRFDKTEDLRIPTGFPGGDPPSNDPDELLTLWRATWIKHRALWRPAVWGEGSKPRSLPDPRPWGWEDGPERERLEHLTAMTTAATYGWSVAQILDRIGPGPFKVREAYALLGHLVTSKGRSPDLEE